MEHLLSLQNLHVSYHTPRGIVQAVRGIDLTLDAGEVLAVVGESGCGKSALLKAITIRTSRRIRKSSSRSCVEAFSPWSFRIR